MVIAGVANVVSTVVNTLKFPTLPAPGDVLVHCNAVNYATAWIHDGRLVDIKTNETPVVINVKRVSDAMKVGWHNPDGRRIEVIVLLDARLYTRTWLVSDFNNTFSWS